MGTPADRRKLAQSLPPLADADAAATAGLQIVEGGVGAGHQPRGIPGVAREEGATHAHAAIDVLAGIADRQLHLHPGQLRLIAQFRHQNRKFIAA